MDPLLRMQHAGYSSCHVRAVLGRELNTEANPVLTC